MTESEHESVARTSSPPISRASRPREAQEDRGQDVRDTRGPEAHATRGQDAHATRGQDAHATRGQDAHATRGQDAHATETAAFGRWLGPILLFGNIALWAILFALWAVVPGVLGWMGKPEASKGFQDFATTLMRIAGLALVLPQVAVLLVIPGIRAVARQTFAQCVRMKITAVFVVAIILELAVTGSTMRGDGTLAGAAKTFLSYSITFAGAFLSIVTVIWGASLISNDVRDKVIFSVASKPLPRWQYVIGRWLGLVLVQAAFLLPAAGAIYAVAQYVRAQETVAETPVQPGDRLAVETEVFACRQLVNPMPIDVEPAVADRMKQLHDDQTAWKAAVEEYKLRSGGDENAAVASIEDEFRKQFLAQAQSAAPFPAEDENKQPINSSLPESVRAYAGQMQRLTWLFEGVQVAGQEHRGEGKVVGKLIADPASGTVLAQFEASPSLKGRLMYMGPVRVGNLNGRVEVFRPKTFWARFYVTDSTIEELKSLSDGKEVTVTAEPVIQVRYKTGTFLGDDDTLHGLWIAVNPTTGEEYPQMRDDPAKSQATLTFPARLVDDQGKLALQFVNRSNRSVTILQSDVGVLYPVGRFEWNFLRATLLVLLNLMFLGAVGILAGSFLSFPVACLFAFVVAIVGLAKDWVADAVAPPGVRPENLDAWSLLAAGIMKMMKLLLPDLGPLSPSDALVGGLNLSWGHIGELSFLHIALRALLVLGLACWIFHRRELARVQV